MKNITRSVWILSLVSLFTDMASEMLYPIMPIFLQSIGFSVLLIGILEGLAEATAGLSKGYFGQQSDLMGRRVPFVQLGYGLSALTKPLMALFFHPLWIFSLRTLDRLGKGIRTGARDALLSDEATPATKAQVFGFHRSMDTTGAVLGPALALLFLYFYPGQYRLLFVLAFFPGLLAILATLYLKEKKQERPVEAATIRSPFSYFGYWRKSNPEYRQLVAGLLIFALFNSSDVLLLLKVKQSGLDDTVVIGIYIFYNLVYALFAYPLGILADRWGKRNIFIMGLLIFAGVYIVIAFTNNLYVYLGLFLLYGLYAAATEGISKAWISGVSAKTETATAIGLYASLQSLCSMLASALAGLIWWKYGAGATFLLSGTVVLIVAGYFRFAVQKNEIDHS
ncbi:MFS transporter [Haliscomenobacter sp.]|uniref:MFS transporter n=1 Tax=Haliscomenobacter sp. TaxID=2717303 RepID=UPI0033652EC1